MTKPPALWLSLFILLDLEGTTLGAEHVESAEAELLSAWDKIGTLSAAVTARGQSFTSRFDERGTYECMKKGDALLFRLEVQTKGALSGSGIEWTTSGRRLVVGDGAFVYALLEIQETHSRSTARKLPLDAKHIVRVAGRRLFEELRDTYDLKVLTDERAGGRSPYYVIEATAKTRPKDEEAAVPELRHLDRPHGMPPTTFDCDREVLTFDKGTGILLERVGYDWRGEVAFTINVFDIKVNRPVSHDRFEFEVPEGIELEDSTGAERPTGPMQPGRRR